MSIMAKPAMSTMSLSCGQRQQQLCTSDPTQLRIVREISFSIRSWDRILLPTEQEKSRHYTIPSWVVEIQTRQASPSVFNLQRSGQFLGRYCPVLSIDADGRKEGRVQGNRRQDSLDGGSNRVGSHWRNWGTGGSIRIEEETRRDGMARLAQLALVGVVAAAVAAYFGISNAYGGDREAMMQSFDLVSKKLGVWAMPVYVLTHTLAIAMCFPYAVAFEAGAAFVFGFVNGVVCVFSAKVMGAALAFGIGRALFHCSPSASSFVRNNKYFSVLNKGVARDGWKFVLLARFSPVPSYIINYGLAATDVRFFVDFLLPTLAGGIPMILQNASLGTLTSAATAGGSKKSVLSFVLPLVGILSGILISWRIKRYASQEFTPAEEEKVKVKGSKGSIAGELKTGKEIHSVLASGDSKVN